MLYPFAFYVCMRLTELLRGLTVKFIITNRAAFHNLLAKLRDASTEADSSVLRLYSSRI